MGLWAAAHLAYPRTGPGQQEVPCIFFMGDSQIDNGNNNYISTRSKANYSPYGVDYPGGPTGRFTNGKNMADFIAKFLGFNKSIPPFATASGREILTGVNYGSGAAGILVLTGSTLGDRLSMDMQLFNHKLTILRTTLLMGNATLASEHLKKCLYVVNIGSNDYLNNYLMPQNYLTTPLFSPQKFARLLIDVYKKQLRALYKDGARKVVVFGLGLLGCVPQVISMHPTHGSSCVDSINNITQHFNNRLKPLIDTLNADLDGAQYIMINSTSIASGDLSTLGIKITNASCCVVSDKTTGLCDRAKRPCSNKDEYYFWDQIHPTQTATRAMAARAYAADQPADAYPFDIRPEFLGFQRPIPPFATTKGTEVLEGVNYASGGGGILEQSGKELLINHGITAFKIATLLGNATLAKARLNKCLYIVYMGSNDYLNNYLMSKYFLTSTLYTPQEFAAILIDHYRRQLRTLYNYGPRKVAIFGLAQIGSIPEFQSPNPSFGSLTSDSINKVTQHFNNGLKPLIDDLNTNLDGAQFILINYTSIAQGDPSTIGIRVTNAPCCVVSNTTGLCEVGKKPCSNVNEYYFWDNFHPTETANRAIATRAYAAKIPSDAYPTDIWNLVRK
ncbi:hypothetical protein C2S51_016516 [Perilla frutescens var. frutescens]|nr:hypothetical protein C2S51_016516 [Perilla frutescens var. frutescens]